MSDLLLAQRHSQLFQIYNSLTNVSPKLPGIVSLSQADGQSLANAAWTHRLPDGSQV